MPHLFASAENLLRRTTPPAEQGGRLYLARLAILLTSFGLLYGALMGSFRVINGQDLWLRQMGYSAVKVPILLAGSFFIGLPSFFVLTTLLGLRSDFGQSVRALVAAQAGMAVALASLGPLTLFWYASSPDYHQALAFNGLMFAVASLAAQYLLRGYYRPLVRRDPRHRQLLACWALIYMLVAIQLAWLLRPFIGSTKRGVEFLRPEAWDNAYVIVARLVWKALGF